MDSYQAIYDAARSRIGHFDGQALVQEISSRFDISLAVEVVKQEYCNAAISQQRPSVLFRPKLTIDGNQWCALYGEDLQEGIAGFGDTPELAMRDFDKNWFEFTASPRA